MNYVGELAAILAALLWTVSSIFWGRIQLPAMTLNFAKNIVGGVMILLHLAVLALVLQQPMFAAKSNSWIWLSLSGLIGILIGDAFYFRSLQILGPRIALVLSTTSPIFSVGLSLLLLPQDQIPMVVFTGILITVVSVIVVVQSRQSEEAPGLMPGSESLGIWTGILGAICQSLGGVLSKYGLKDLETGEDVCDPIEGTLIRILVAAVGSTLLILFQGEMRSTVKKVFTWSQLKLIIPATAIGTWLGICLSLVAFQKASSVPIAQTLLAMCPLFAIPVMWYLGKYQFTVSSILGTVFALLGVLLMLM